MKIAVVGAGLSGATVAYFLREAGHEVEVFEKRNHVGGNCHTEVDDETGILVHKYGPHIFHTSNTEVELFVRKFARWEPFTLRMKSVLRGTIFSAPPINLHTINQFFGTKLSPAQAKDYIAARCDKHDHPATFEEAALSTVGWELYNAFLRGYTQKQWGTEPSQLPASVYARLPLRFDYDDNKYPSHEWQAMPIHGYSTMVRHMLQNILVNYEKFERERTADFNYTFYTGPMDEWFNYTYGRLGYRTLDFDIERTDGDYQGAPVVCYPEYNHPYTRTTEHKHFAPWEKHNKTIVYHERPREFWPGDEPFYPIRLAHDKANLEQYQWLIEQEKNVTFVGRLATYRYIDMDQAIWEAMQAAQKFIKDHP